ncbi:MAG: hypothetical protein ACHP84_15270 [Caulobacterales bacterium]
MSATRCAALAAALWLIPGGAALAADPNFEALRRICIDTHADRDGAFAEAKAEGFARPPASVVKSLTSKDLENGAFRARFVDDAMQFVIVGERRFPAGPGFKVAVCGLAIVPTDTASEDALTAWSEVPPQDGEDGGSFMLFVGEPGHRTPALDIPSDRLEALAREGAVQLTGVSHTDAATILIYGVVQP